MSTLDEQAPAILEALSDHYGRPDSGPVAEVGAFTAMVAALLGQSLEPRKVASAVAALGEADLLRPEALADADAADLAETLRAGAVRSTPKILGPLGRLARWVVDRTGGVASIEAASTSTLREELVGLNGIGPSTADAILLHGLGRASYPVDRPSYRVAARHGWIDPTADYDEARAVLERIAPGKSATLAAMAEWSERLGRDFCRATVARCEKCPLRPFLPEGGPRDPDE